MGSNPAGDRHLKCRGVQCEALAGSASPTPPARVSDRLQSRLLAPEPHRATHTRRRVHMDRATVDQLLTTTRTVRKRLDLRRPVEPAVIQECLELAIQAPNGGNQNQDPGSRPDVLGRLGTAALDPQRGRCLKLRESLGGTMDLATVDKLLTTTRSVRARLDLTRLVPPALIEDAWRSLFRHPKAAGTAVITSSSSPIQPSGEHSRTSTEGRSSSSTRRRPLPKACRPSPVTPPHGSLYTITLRTRLP